MKQTQKKAFITGANKGIGFETARQLLQQGYDVFIGCRDAAKGNAAIQLLKEQGYSNVTLVQIDVADAASAQEASAVVQEATDYLDVLVNNAGILGATPQTPSSVDVTTLRQIFDTNFFGAIQTTQAFIHLLRKSTAPRIVNVTSGLASLTRHSDPNWKYYNYKNAGYGPSKTALNAYTVALAHELKDTPFKVNCIDPGHTATDFNNYRGTQPVDEAAKVVVQFAMLDKDGPTGKFYNAAGEEPW